MPSGRPALRSITPIGGPVDPPIDPASPATPRSARARTGRPRCSRSSRAARRGRARAASTVSCSTSSVVIAALIRTDASASVAQLHHVLVLEPRDLLDLVVAAMRDLERGERLAEEDAGGRRAARRAARDPPRRAAPPTRRRGGSRRGRARSAARAWPRGRARTRPRARARRGGRARRGTPRGIGRAARAATRWREALARPCPASLCGRRPPRLRHAGADRARCRPRRARRCARRDRPSPRPASSATQAGPDERDRLLLARREAEDELRIELLRRPRAGRSRTAPGGAGARVAHGHDVAALVRAWRPARRRAAAARGSGAGRAGGTWPTSGASVRPRRPPRRASGSARPSGRPPARSRFCTVLAYV